MYRLAETRAGHSLALGPSGLRCLSKGLLPGVVKHSRNGIQVSSTKQCMASIGIECLGRTFVGRESSGDYARLGKIADLSQLTTSSVGLAKGAHTCNKEASQGVGCCQPAGTSTCPAVLCAWRVPVRVPRSQARQKEGGRWETLFLESPASRSSTLLLSRLSLLCPPPLLRPLPTATTAARISDALLPAATGLFRTNPTYMHAYT